MNDELNNSIADGHVVTMHYSLTLDDGRLVDSSRGQEPFAYLHGARNIVPGLEAEMAGKEVGDKFSVTVDAENAYGPRVVGAEQSVPRAQLPPQLEVAPGMPLTAERPDGSQVTVFVTDVADDAVTVDLNHPLAGETLHFDVEVMGIRDASAEERDHGHPHGPGGHHD